MHVYVCPWYYNHNKMTTPPLSSSATCQERTTLLSEPAERWWWKENCWLPEGSWHTETQADRGQNILWMALGGKAKESWWLVVSRRDRWKGEITSKGSLCMECGNTCVMVIKSLMLSGWGLSGNDEEHWLGYVGEATDEYTINEGRSTVQTVQVRRK